jgi:hypothetical protein
MVSATAWLVSKDEIGGQRAVEEGLVAEVRVNETPRRRESGRSGPPIRKALGVVALHPVG